MDIFQEVQNLNQDVARNLMIEPAAMVQGDQVWPGIHIEAQEMYAPIFLSSFELRRLADECDKIISEQIST